MSWGKQRIFAIIHLSHLLKWVHSNFKCAYSYMSVLVWLDMCVKLVERTDIVACIQLCTMKCILGATFKYSHGGVVCRSKCRHSIRHHVQGHTSIGNAARRELGRWMVFGRHSRPSRSYQHIRRGRCVSRSGSSQVCMYVCVCELIHGQLNDVVNNVRLYCAHV